MRLLVWLLIVAALGLGAWMLLREPADEDLALEGLERADTDAPTGPTLEGLEGQDRRATRAPTGRSSLIGRVSRDGTLAAAEVTLKFLHGRVGPDLTHPRRGVDYYRRVVFGRPPAAPLVVATRPTDASGRFEFAGLGLGVFRVEARASDGARGMSVVALAPEGIRVTTEVRLAAPGTAFEGRVEWNDGAAFEGDLIVTPNAGVQDGWGAQFRSSAEGVAVALTDGSFRIEGLGAGRFSVIVGIGDHLVAAGPSVSLPQREPYKLVVLRPTRELRGRVLVKGEETPIPDAEVYAAARGGEGGPGVPSARTATDGDGRFSVRIAPGPGWLTVAAAGFSGRSVTLAADAQELTLLLSRTGGVRGQVVSVSDAAPVAGTVVHATGKDGTTLTATTDREGRFAIDGVSSGEAQVFVRGGGWISPELGRIGRDGRGGYNPLAVEIRSGQQTSLELRAERAGSLHGRVIDPGGSPVAGAVIVGRADVPSFGRGSGSAPATAGPDGTFRVEDLSVGSALTFDVRAPEHAPTRSGPHAVTAEDPAALEIRLEAPRWVDALVLTQGTDVPVADATVQLMRTENFGSNRSRTQDATAVTGPDGRARLGPVGPGPLHVWAHGGGIAGLRQSEQAEVEGSGEGKAELSVTLRMRALVQVEGRVELPDGTPAVGARISREVRPGRFDSTGQTTGADGRFRHQLEQQEELSLRADFVAADGSRLTAAGAAVPQTKDLVLRLARDERPLRTLTVRVTDANGAPVARAQISLVSESRDGGSSSWGQPVQDGLSTFELANEHNETLARLDQGRAFLTVTQARDDNDLPLPLGPARFGPIAKDQREIAIRLPAEKRIEGRVLGPDGRALRGVLVRAAPQEPPGEGGSHRQQRQHEGEGRSGEDGAFRVGGLGDGLYTLTVFGPAAALAPILEPVPSGTLDVVISFRGGVTGRVRVTDAQGSPVPSCQVSATPSSTGDTRIPPHGSRFDPSGPARSAQTGLDGLAVLEGLDGETTYSLRVQPGDAAALLTFTEQAWHPGDLAVRLERGYTVAGVARDLNGRPVRGATVYRQTGEGSWSGAATDAQGRFRITGLPAGPVVLRAAAPGDMGEWNREGAPEVSVPGGTENVEFVLDPGVELLVELVLPAGVLRPNGYALLIIQRDGQAQGVTHGHWSKGSPLRFPGLKLDQRYAVWVAPQQDDWYGWLADARAGGGAPAKMRFERGQSIRGRLNAPADATQLGVNAHDTLGRNVQGVVAADGSYEIKGVPPGAWTVSARCQKDQEQWHAQAAGDAGATIDLVLERRVR